MPAQPESPLRLRRRGCRWVWDRDMAPRAGVASCPIRPNFDHPELHVGEHGLVCFEREEWFAVLRGEVAKQDRFSSQRQHGRRESGDSRQDGRRASGYGCAVASRRLDVTRTEATVALGTSPSCRTVQRRAGFLRRPDRRGHEADIDGRIVGMRLGIAHHFGWAVAVMASADYEVVDRRRIELIEPGVPMAPIHHEGGPHLLHRSSEPLSDDDLTTLVAEVRASVVRATSAAMDELVASSPEPVVSMSLRAWPADFPSDIATQRRVPYESRADSVMYCQVLAELARERGWVVHPYNAKRSRTKPSASWVREQRKCFRVRGRNWGHHGRRTIEWRSQRRSWPADLALRSMCSTRRARRRSLGT